MRRTMLGWVALVLLCGGGGSYAAEPSREDLTALSVGALSESREEATRAIAALRAQGPAGLDALMSACASAIARHREEPTRPQAMWDRLSAALDAVAAQKDAWAAGLYWYTDFDAAKRAATAAGKPILSLRLLGTLDTEFSCANSRFFRTVLYPNAEVGRALRDGYVLHWQSHRPVPRLTIDYGDGRRIERTITGNSVHYVLTPDGRAVDVIPGLYGPAAFLRALSDAGGLAKASAAPDFERAIVDYHSTRLSALRAAWDADLRRLGLAAPAATAPNGTAVQLRKAAPTAMAGTRITASKSAVEILAVAAIAPERAALASATDDAAWAKLAALHADDGRLDASSRTVIRAKVGGAAAANAVSRSKARVEDPVVRIVANFERSVAEDTVRNEYLFHGQVHEWFARRQVPPTLDALNERVYADLFLMPSNDPWLGLVPADAYTGLPADEAVRKHP